MPKAFAISWVVVALGVAAIVARGDKTLSIDFTGGDIVTLAFNADHKIPIGKITELSTSTSDTGLGEIQAAYQTDLASKTERLVLQVESEKGERVFNMLSKKFPSADLKLVAQQSVGASVSGKSPATRRLPWLFLSWQSWFISRSGSSSVTVSARLSQQCTTL